MVNYEVCIREKAQNPCRYKTDVTPFFTFFIWFGVHIQPLFGCMGKADLHPVTN